MKLIILSSWVTIIDLGFFLANSYTGDSSSVIEFPCSVGVVLELAPLMVMFAFEPFGNKDKILISVQSNTFFCIIIGSGFTNVLK